MFNPRGGFMSIILCTSCNQRKREENFSDVSLIAQKPTCTDCDLNTLLGRISKAKEAVGALQKQQQALKQQPTPVHVKTGVKKATKKDYLKKILGGKAA